MNGKLPDRIGLGADKSQFFQRLSSAQSYPEIFVFHTADLEALDFNARTASILSQLCDVLMLVEKSCARSLNLSTEPIAHCTVFLLEQILRMVETQRKDPQYSTPNDF